MAKAKKQKNIFSILFIVFSLFLFLPGVFAIYGNSTDQSIIVSSTTISAGLIKSKSANGVVDGRTSVGAAGFSVTLYSGGGITGTFGPDLTLSPKTTAKTETAVTEEDTSGSIPGTNSGSRGGGEDGTENSDSEEETTENEQVTEEEQTENSGEDETANEQLSEEEQTDRQESAVTIKLLSSAYTEKAKKTVDNIISGIKENKETVIGVFVGTALICSAFYYNYRKKMKRKTFLDYFSKTK